MSLSSLIRDPQVIEILAPLRPKAQRKLTEPILAAPRSRRYPLVGTAFDYLLRFEVQRRADVAHGRHWVAEHAPELLRYAADGECQIEVVFAGNPPQLVPPPGGFRRAAKRAEAVIEDARFAVAEYCIADEPAAGSLAALAVHAIRLARLDLVFRARIFDTRISEAPREDVDDLLAMLGLVPFDTLLYPKAKHVLLNPIFGDASAEVGGADCDLIIGNRLIDVKVSQEPRVRSDQLDQLLGYYLLGRRARRTDKRFPELRRAALYFPRRAYLWEIDVTTWTEHPEFRAGEELFFRRASELKAIDERVPRSADHDEAGAVAPREK